ncbi:MAG: outer membrane lipoprotein-sorting protein, partial [Akkermansiaceae bacterium]
MKKLLLNVFAASLFIGASAYVHADTDAERILEGVRHGAALQNGKLTGHLRKDGKRTPLTLTMNKQVISFQFFTNNKWGGFQMQLRQGNAKLFNLAQGKAKPFPAKQIGQAILGSDVTYEDLSLRFLYWKDAKIEGEEVIKTQKCHKIRLNNPGKDGRYKTVYIWVHQKYGALMQVAGYDSAGNLLKRFHVTELMK